MIVFDAEPLIAYYGDESGSDRVEARLRTVEKSDRKGIVNAVTCTEIHQVVRRDDEQRAEEYLSRLRNWCQVVDAGPVWSEASLFKHRYGCALGYAFTLATAYERDATAFVGADDDFGEIREVDVERFRTESV